MKALFTLLVSWLLVAGIPVLLMLAALGLGWLEKELARGPVAMIAVDELVERTGGVDMRTLAREGMPEAQEYLHRRQAQQLSSAALTGRNGAARHAAAALPVGFTDRDEMTLPTRIQSHSLVNPQFKAPRYVNRV